MQRPEQKIASRLKQTQTLIGTAAAFSPGQVQGTSRSWYLPCSTNNRPTPVRVIHFQYMIKNTSPKLLNKRQQKPSNINYCLCSHCFVSGPGLVPQVLGQSFDPFGDKFKIYQAMRKTVWRNDDISKLDRLILESLAMWSWPLVNPVRLTVSALIKLENYTFFIGLSGRLQRMQRMPREQCEGTVGTRWALFF